MDNIEKMKENNKDLELLNSIGEGLNKICEAGEKDPLLMTDAEFNNWCNFLTVNRAQIDLMKKSIAAAEDILDAADIAMQLAKIIRRNRE